MQHIDEMLENKWLICLLKTFREENEIADTEVKVPEVVKEAGVDPSLQNLNMLTSTQGEMNNYATTVKELKGNLLFKGKFVGDEQENVAEGDILRDIQEVWEVATFLAKEAKFTVVAIEIVSIRRLMMKVSQKQQTSARKLRNLGKRKTREECESIVGGKLQSTLWLSLTGSKCSYPFFLILDWLHWHYCIT